MPQRDPDFRLTVGFKPSFQPDSEVTFTSESGRASIVIRYSNLRTTVPCDETFDVDSTQAKVFLAELQRLALLPEEDDRRIGLDGVTVEGRFEPKGGAGFSFRCWSPTPDVLPREYGVIKALYAVFDGIKISAPLNDYLEQLSIYFDFGLPAKALGGNPFRVRFYGSLSSREETHLEKFIDRLPRDEPVLIDMTNFNGMGTLLYPYFQRLLKQSHSITWIAGGRAKQQLLELGVPETTIDPPMQ